MDARESTQAGLPGGGVRSVTALIGLGTLIALWPVLVVHLAYGLSVLEGYVPLCNPYWDGCTSISRAGRYGWANHLFKGALLPYAALLGVWWWLNQRWLIASTGDGSYAMLFCGVTGMLFLILYLTFLGSDGPIYQLLRRHGINVYVGATFIAQLLLIGRLGGVAARRPVPWPHWLVPTMLAVALVILAMGLVFAATDFGLPLDRVRMQNTLEWSAALLMQSMMLLAVLGWRATGLQVIVAASGRHD